MQQNNPVFIIGAARSGTTLLYEALCRHKDVAYVTDIMDSEYHKAYLRQTRGSVKFLADRLLGRQWRPTIESETKPNEANSLWLMYMPYWKVMDSTDLTSDMVKYYHAEIGRIAQRRMFVNKNPHHSYRVQLLASLFHDCKFVHIIRDGRAVAYSEYARRGRDWNDGPIRALLKDDYHPDRSQLYNIGQEWSFTVRIARQHAVGLASRYVEVRYEDLVADPDQTLTKVLDFCGLSMYEGFDVPKTRDENIKWMQHLKEHEKLDIEESTYELRSELGYS